LDWKSEYKKKWVSPAQAVSTITSGDTVVIPVATEPVSLSSALINRRNELTDVNILIRMPRCDFGWFSEDFGDAFNVRIDTQPGEGGAKAITTKKVDYAPCLYGLRFKFEDDSRLEHMAIDAVMVVVSPPDQHGFCSFGTYLSHKKDYVARAKKVLAEVDMSRPMNIRLPGDNYIHVSEIDSFVEHIDFPVPDIVEKKTDETDRLIAKHVSTIIRDGDTIQLGPGLPSKLPSLEAFDEMNDLGVHSPIVWPGMIDLVKRGIITGKRKNIHTGKCVSSGFRGIRKPEDIEFIDGNIMFEVRNSSYVNNLQVIAANDRMVSINGVLSVDLNGQVAADSIGGRMFGGAGGLVDFNIGALFSKRGSSIFVLRSTLKEGKSSRIVSSFPPGTLVTIPWTFVDHVVTEYGVARLLGKTRKQRARELITIAHPHFRSELEKDLKNI
jgi:4-hydroxybutyrate CoA-transferase